MTRQLFPSPSQGALICAGGGKEGRLAAAQRAGEPGGRTQLCTPGLGLAAARFPPRLPDPRGTQFLEAKGSQRRPASAPFSILTMSLGRNCWFSPPVAGPESGARACVRDPAAGQRVSDTGRLQNLHRVAWGQGPAYLWTSLSVVVFFFNPGTWTRLL